MSTPKEKAVDLVNRFKNHVNPYTGSGMLSNTHDDSAILWQSKRCALIAVDEILNYHDSLFDLGLKNVHQTFETSTEIYNDVMNPRKKFWQQVRTEIENL